MPVTYHGYCYNYGPSETETVKPNIEMDIPAPVSVLIPARGSSQIHSLLLDIEYEKRTTKYETENLEVLVICSRLDSATHNSLKIAETQGATFLVVYVPMEWSKFEALQEGAKASTGEWLICCDSDIRLKQGAFLALLRQRSPPVGAVAGRLLSGEKTDRSHYLVGLWHKLSYEAWHRVRLTQPHNRWALPGPLFMIRRDHFPDSIPVSTVDDACIGLNVYNLGASIRYCPHARAVHPVPAGIVPWYRQKLRTRRGWLRLRFYQPAQVNYLWRCLRKGIMETEDRAWLRVCLLGHDRFLWIVARISVAIRGMERTWEPVELYSDKMEDGGTHGKYR
jgi:cellulose synthase/poly-beta-1,6-N-acetylglucosamine synthase-like glycosyltransferase